MNKTSGKKIMSTTVFAAIIVILAFSAMCTSVSAQPTEEEIKQAIDNGTAWLAAQQNDYDGSWGTWDKVARTAFAVKKLEHHAMDPKYGYGLDSPFDPAYPYADNVSRGLNYIFANAHIIKISNQTHDGKVDNPDTNGNGIGVYFVDGGPTAFHRTYETGIALMAITESNAQDKVVDVLGSEVNDWTYHDVAQDTVDYLAWGQTDAGTGRGGWGYYENYPWNWSDNSNSGYAVLGLQYAQAPKPEGFGLTIPQFVKDELNIWIDYIQCKEGVPCTGFGGSGYDSPCYWVNILKTGNLLKEMAFVGDTADTPRVQNATAYLCCHWKDTADPGWRPNHYQAMYTTMKGLTALDIHEICEINWQADFEQAIVAQQNANGSWSGCPYYCSDEWCYIADNILCTEWALLTLQKVVPPPPMTPGKVTGGGQIEASVQTGGKKVDKANFGFNVMYQEGDPAPKGELEYIDHATNMNVHAHDMTRLFVSDDKTWAEFEGTCTIDGVSGYTFEAYVEDNNEPGKNDWFEITLSTGYTAGGELLSGNIQIHKKP